jgi:hypothetical protein
LTGFREVANGQQLKCLTVTAEFTKEGWLSMPTQTSGTPRGQLEHDLPRLRIANPIHSDQTVPQSEVIFY